MTLFRDAVSRGRAADLPGTINLALPVSWRVISLALGSIVLVIVIFLSLATHARTETVSGNVLPDTGILQIMPARAGRVETISITEGQAVRKGQLLARIRVEEADRDGSDAQSAVLRALADQQASADRQAGLIVEAAQSEQRQYAAQIAGFREELKSIVAQIDAQRALVTMARRDLAQARTVAERGFISRRDIANREETLLSREQQLSVLEQARAAKSASMAAAISAGLEARSRASALGASIARDRSQIERDSARTRSEQGFALLAPEDGSVAALAIHRGDAVSPGVPTMLIVPRGGRLIARFLLPVKASGFVRKGQSLRLAMDAYPYDRFGTVAGVITSVSNAPIMQKDASGVETPYYIGTAAIVRPVVFAYGRSRPLIPGMTFSARITTERRTLRQWLFDPVYAAVRE